MVEESASACSRAFQHTHCCRKACLCSFHLSQCAKRKKGRSGDMGNKMLVTGLQVTQPQTGHKTLWYNRREMALLPPGSLLALARVCRYMRAPTSKPAATATRCENRVGSLPIGLSDGQLTGTCSSCFERNTSYHVNFLSLRNYSPVVGVMA